jgi:hypothetical protein
MQLMKLCGAIFALSLSAAVLAQDRPAAMLGQEVQAVVTVRAINHDTRVVTVETQDGRQATFQAPEEARNLDQVRPGSRFKVRYREAVAVAVLASNEAPSVEVTQTVEGAPKGANPSGEIAQLTRIAGRIEQIDRGARLLVIRGPQGKLREFAVNDEVRGLDAVQAGDAVVLVYSQALALEMIPE